jgi:hypothetical protein
MARSVSSPTCPKLGSALKSQVLSRLASLRRKERGRCSRRKLAPWLNPRLRRNRKRPILFSWRTMTIKISRKKRVSPFNILLFSSKPNKRRIPNHCKNSNQLSNNKQNPIKLVARSYKVRCNPALSKPSRPYKTGPSKSLKTNQCLTSSPAKTS